MVSMLRLARAILPALVALGVVAAQEGEQQKMSSQWPRHNNGLNNVVEWDHYSYFVNGERLFIFSGEVINPQSLLIHTSSSSVTDLTSSYLLVPLLEIPRVRPARLQGWGREKA